jgi:polysaccharide biosynthesis/export protein
MVRAPFSSLVHGGRVGRAEGFNCLLTKSRSVPRPPHVSSWKFSGTAWEPRTNPDIFAAVDGALTIGTAPLPKPMRNRWTEAMCMLVVLAISGCVGGRSINYLQDGALTESPKLFENERQDYRIQVNDVLSIRVLGLDEKSHNFFNIEGREGNGFMNDLGLYVNGFSVDKNGLVQLPTVGRVKVLGLTAQEAQDVVQRKVGEYYSNATVILKMVSFRVSVLGAVGAPGAYLITRNQVSLLEALAMAGGPSELADKEKVTLVRQTDKGAQALHLDMSNTQVLSSPYYYLLPNDVLYVPAARARIGRLNLEVLSLFLSAITTTVLVINLIQNSRNNTN